MHVHVINRGLSIEAADNARSRSKNASCGVIIGTIAFTPEKGCPMKHSKLTRFLSVFMSFVLAASFALPATAFAAEKEVRLDNHTAAEAATVVSGIAIDGVDAPQPGSPLDDTATVTTAEGEQWDIPVFWVASNMELATSAVEGLTYLPALAFFVPGQYSVEGDGYTVELSDSLAKLFGGNEVISVYDASTGITFILPATLREFFASASQAIAPRDPSSAQTDVEAEPQAKAAESPLPESEPASESEPAGSDTESADETERQSLVDIYCAQTARDALSDADLEYLLDLIINKLQPQAVNLLLESFPSFRAGADEGSIGTEISLYVYYRNGDKDGLPEHQNAEPALAYVSGDAVKQDGEYVYCYMIGVDIDSLLKTDKNRGRIVDESTGKYVLLRSGTNVETFENTIVHEMFHAFMDDYNRTGMAGVTNINDYVTDENGKFPTQALFERYNSLHFPKWFIEGTASAVENTYQFRHNIFELLRVARDGDGELADNYTTRDLLYNYLNGRNGKNFLYFDISFSGGGTDSEGHAIDTDQSRYVTGYLATLYVCELAARNVSGSAVTSKGGEVAISSEKLRMGLDSILERMHKGESFDQIIRDISPAGSNGKKLYTSVDDFENKFVKGPSVDNKTYDGDIGSGASLEFVLTFLNYMHSLEGTNGPNSIPNGSLLVDFSYFGATPLSLTKNAKAKYYNIIESNRYHKSTVPDSIAMAGGGKSTTKPTATTAKALPAGSPNATFQAAAIAHAAKTVVREIESAKPGVLVKPSEPSAPSTAEATAPAAPVAPAVPETPETPEAPASEAAVAPEAPVATETETANVIEAPAQGEAADNDSASAESAIIADADLNEPATETDFAADSEPEAAASGESAEPNVQEPVAVPEAEAAVADESATPDEPAIPTETINVPEPEPSTPADSPDAIEAEAVVDDRI